MRYSTWNRVVVMLCFCCGSLSASAATIYVNAKAASGGNGQDWAHAYRDLQDALAAAALAGGANAIWVATGTYKPTTGSDPTATFLVPDQTSIFGGFRGRERSLAERKTSTNKTVLSGDLFGNDLRDRSNPAYASSKMDNSFHVVTIPNGAIATLNGLEVSAGAAHGSAMAPPFSGIGAGIYVDSAALDDDGSGGGNAHLTLRDVVIAHNDADSSERASFGGGLWQLSGTLVIDRATFADNMAPLGGGAFVAGYYAWPKAIMESVVVTNSSFDANISTDVYDGTIVLRARGIDIESNVFSNNRGGETTFQLFHPKGQNNLNKALIVGNTFAGNAASTGFAAAMEIFARVSSADGEPTLSLRNNIFSHNTSSDFGGAIFVTGAGDVLFDGNTFTNNSAGVGGGAMYFDVATGNVIIRNCQFIQNAVGSSYSALFLSTQAAAGFFFSPAARLGGGAILADDGTSLHIQNSTFVGNVAPRGGAISVPGYSYMVGDPWDYSVGLPDFSALTVLITNPASVTVAGASSFANNQAIYADGGAIFVGAVAFPETSFLDGTFPALTAFGSTDFSVTGSAFRNDTAAQYGGAIAGDSTGGTIAQNSFVNDQAASAGSHIFLTGSVANSYSTTTQTSQAKQALSNSNSFKSPGLAGVFLQ